MPFGVGQELDDGSMVCEEHGLDYCHRCCLDFRDMNADNSEQMATAEAITCSRTNCFNKGTLCCSRCKMALYCSASCQKLHWKDHKMNCIQAGMVEPTFGGALVQHSKGTKCRLKQPRIDALIAEGRHQTEAAVTVTVLRYIPSVHGKVKMRQGIGT